MDLRTQRTLKSLSKAAVGLIHEKPLNKITVSELCDHAMIRRPTFYRYFPTKEDLFLHVIREQRKSVQDRLMGEEFKDVPVREYALAMTREFVGLAAEHRQVYRTLALDDGFGPMLAIAADEVSREFARFLAVREGAEEPTEDQLYLGMFYANGLFGALRFWLSQTPDQTEEDFMSAYEPIVSSLF